MVLTHINVYPVKSLGGIAGSEAVVEPWGLEADRRWLVLNPDGSVLTAREQHRMLGLGAVPDANGAITLVGRDGSTVHVDAPVHGPHEPAGISRLESVRLAGADADRWLSLRLGQPVRLGWLDDPRRRSVSAAHGGLAGDPLSLADAGPLLLTARASLDQLNRWISDDAARLGAAAPAEMEMARFRPSVVVDGTGAAFVEDRWRRVRIGEVEFRFAERCDRCVLTTVDPATLDQGKEPLRTLARHRRYDRKTWFGIRLIPVTGGVIRVGDAVAAA